jgi:hypothetical protein
MSRLRELEERRAYECRLTPDRALASLDDAEAFLHERGLLTRTADSALPSLYEACHEEPYAPATGGFGSWPRTKWWWAGALAERAGVYVLKIHRGKNLFMTEATAALADPICRAELARMELADPRWARLLAHLRAAGPSELEDLQTELGLKPKQLKDLRSPLERCGAIVSRGLVLETSGGGHAHTSELVRWDQVFPEPAGATAEVDDLIVAGVRAAVLAPERELPRWFSWSWRFRDGLVDDLVASGRLERPEPGWVTVPEPL